MEKVSVIMSVYNEQIEWLTESIESILKQTYTNFEFLIVLDNPDNLLIKRKLEEYEIIDERISLFYNESNQGLVNSLNFLLEKASGEYICRMDADDISKLDRLEKQLETIRLRNVNFVYSNVNIISETGVMVSRNKNKEEYNTEQLSILMKYGNSSKHPTWMFDQNVLKMIKNYRHVTYAEDYDFILRCFENDIKVFQMSYCVVDYRYRATSISRSNALNQLLVSNYIKRLYRKKKLSDTKNVEVDIDRINDTIKRVDKEKYAIAREIFYDGVSSIKKKETCIGVVNILKSIFKSKYMAMDVLNNMRYQWVKRTVSHLK